VSVSSTPADNEDKEGLVRVPMGNRDLADKGIGQRRKREKAVEGKRQSSQVRHL
jgi:hypothetical protein